jgi:hypothetical protein
MCSIEGDAEVVVRSLLGETGYERQIIGAINFLLEGLKPSCVVLCITVRCQESLVVSFLQLDRGINEKLTLDVSVSLVVRGPHTIKVNDLVESLQVFLPERKWLTDLEPVDINALLQALGCHQVV